MRGDIHGSFVHPAMQGEGRSSALGGCSQINDAIRRCEWGTFRSGMDAISGSAIAQGRLTISMSAKPASHFDSIWANSSKEIATNFVRPTTRGVPACQTWQTSRRSQRSLKRQLQKKPTTTLLAKCTDFGARAVVNIARPGVTTDDEARRRGSRKPSALCETSWMSFPRPAERLESALWAGLRHRLRGASQPGGVRIRTPHRDEGRIAG